MSSSPFLSIIIPIYNAEASLPRCIDSILNQTFTDFELLLVNDGSRDGSLDVCQKYSIQDDRIRVLDQSNSGVSSARNAGLDKAIGKWVTFIDSDDYLIANGLMDMVSLADGTTDLVVGAIYAQRAQKVYSLGKQMYAEEMLASLITNELTNPCLNAPFAKLFRRDQIENKRLRFDNTLYFGEDSIFVKSYLLDITSLSTVDSPCYYYDDIGDDEFYSKYSKSFAPIYDYFSQTLNLYRKLEDIHGVSISTANLIGVVFELMIRCAVRNGVKDWRSVRLFLINDKTQVALRQRGSNYITVLLILGQMNAALLTLWLIRLVEYSKRWNK